MRKSKMEKWVKALRSGNFKQGKEMLRSEEEFSGKAQYCCLGVLGVVCKIDDETLDRETLSGGLNDDCGIKHEEGAIVDKEGQPVDGAIRVRVGKKFESFNSLASANDGGASFRAIATWIEKNYKKL